MGNFSAILIYFLIHIAGALAHWRYDRLIIDGQIVGEPYQYVRRSNNSNNPLDDLSSTDMRCNAGALSGKSTQTLAVPAGAEIGFAIAKHFGHPGPQQVYLSKAPGAAADYDGSGGWARIYSLTTAPANSSISAKYERSNATSQTLKWASRRMDSFRFTLPASTPPGEYLLRAEGIALHAAHKNASAQFYVSCAQIKLTGNGDGIIGPLVQIPGWYQANDPGILLPTAWERLTTYSTPGPPLWPESSQEQHVVRSL